MQIMAWEITGLEAPGNLKLKRAGSESTRTLAVLDFERKGYYGFRGKDPYRSFHNRSSWNKESYYG